jgi:TfoX/Sxy family transcriptional regulator of competence genes
MTAASDALGARLRPLIGKKPGIVEKKMFGGIGFMLGGNMVIGTTAKGALLVRIDPTKADDALARGAELMHMGPRVMSGFVSVDVAKIPDDAALKDWIAYASKYVKTLPPK